jgi:hypothetical protein
MASRKRGFFLVWEYSSAPQVQANTPKQEKNLRRETTEIIRGLSHPKPGSPAGNPLTSTAGASEYSQTRKKSQESNDRDHPWFKPPQTGITGR